MHRWENNIKMELKEIEYYSVVTFIWFRTIFSGGLF
jgi:hypothetical protein